MTPEQIDTLRQFRETLIAEEQAKRAPKPGLHEDDWTTELLADEVQSTLEWDRKLTCSSRITDLQGKVEMSFTDTHGHEWLITLDMED